MLRLDETEHTYLRTVARPGTKAARRPAAARVRPGVQLLLDSMDRTPAFVLGRRMDVLAWNALGDAVGGFSRLPADECNVPRQVFLARAPATCTPTGPRWPPRPRPICA